MSLLIFVALLLLLDVAAWLWGNRGTGPTGRRDHLAHPGDVTTTQMDVRP